MKEKLYSVFNETFGEGESRMYFAPGRVNLIGEHTDYNGGHVFPCALTIGTYGVARKRQDGKLRFYSLNFEKDGVITGDIKELVPDEKAGWTNYPKGVMWAFEKRGFHMDCGLDLLIWGDIPNGSGLSSSASLEEMCIRDSTGGALMEAGIPLPSEEREYMAYQMYLVRE